MMKNIQFYQENEHREGFLYAARQIVLGEQADVRS